MLPMDPCPTVLSAMEPPAPQGSFRQEATDERVRCGACSDVIGVYEPLVRVLDAVVWHTSRAAEPNLAAAGGVLYHRHCFERAGAGSVGST